ncbi:glutathionylspermidine synthase [Paenibacillus flagellatus]|uniref:Glutathionylspermidine synthase n=2 Tax=Paenibacillus flagellatus TaxID=2211139 RepID=A0A2V5KF54_9BACL|nr:glutathionylspermidine synthase [Paenibacillus flagellatus]
MYDEEYALATILPISETFRGEIAEATERLGALIGRTVGIARQADDALFEELGLPAETWRAVRIAVSESLPTVIGRFDFAMTGEGLKMLEFNADTPTGIVEAFHANGRICAAYGLRDPNEGMADHLRDAFLEAAAAYRDNGYRTDKVVFSALDWHEEDAGTTRYLMRQSGLPGARFAALSELRVFEDRLCVLREDGEHEPIDLLYRLHALEKLAEDRDEDGYPTGAHVLDLMADRRLAVLNPPSALIAQTKAMQALVWNLYEAGEFYTEEEREAIGAYMLPTYMENRFGGGVPYVTKPILGREGGGVTLYEADGTLAERDGEELYWEQPMIYQKRVELPLVPIRHAGGMTEQRLLWGSFWIGGRASAIVARAGGRITGNLAYYVPVGIAEGGRGQDQLSGIGEDVS